MRRTSADAGNPSRRPWRPEAEALETRELLARTGLISGTQAAQHASANRVAVAIPMDVSLAPRSAMGAAADGVTNLARVRIVGRTTPGMMVGLGLQQNGHPLHVTRAGRKGHFSMMVGVKPGVNALKLGTMSGRTMSEAADLMVVRMPATAFRPFNGSPTPPGQEFARLIPHSKAYAPGLPPRPDAVAISQSMAEDPNNQGYSPNIELGLVFFGQLVDHDMTLDDTVGQGPNLDPEHPINDRTPALDLDPVYGRGPHDQPEFYTPDGLFFRLGPGGTDLLRDAHGVAIIGDPRNDDSGLIASIHLAIQKYHNTLMTAALHGADPGQLTPMQKDTLFAMVRNQVIGYYQGIVANQLATAFSGKPVPDREPPIANVPLEFSAAVYRLGHTLVPNTVVIDAQGDRLNPSNPSLRGLGKEIPYELLFGPGAQPAARFDAKLSDTMRTLLIPFSPTDPGQGDLIGGTSPNIGQGQLIDGVLHLDLGETNILRGRELHVPSGEEYLAMLDHRPYDPATDGNTDLFLYMLHEATPLGHLGRVGGDVFDRAIGGLLSADPYRYTNPAVYTPAQTARFRHATFEGLLHTIGAPGF